MKGSARGLFGNQPPVGLGSNNYSQLLIQAQE